MEDYNPIKAGPPMTHVLQEERFRLHQEENPGKVCLSGTIKENDVSRIGPHDHPDK